MDDERLEMNEKMMEMESKAVEVENNLRQQVRNRIWYIIAFTSINVENFKMGKNEIHYLLS